MSIITCLALHLLSNTHFFIHFLFISLLGGGGGDEM
jgi:hypothetical protein